MSARFKLVLKQENTNDEATIEINGSDEWLKKILPLIGLTIAGVAKQYGFDRQNATLVDHELRRAHEALNHGRNFAGQFVIARLDSASVEEIGKGFSSPT